MVGLDDHKGLFESKGFYEFSFSFVNVAALSPALHDSEGEPASTLNCCLKAVFVEVCFFRRFSLWWFCFLNY